jgi:hypothetical protein
MVTSIGMLLSDWSNYFFTNLPSTISVQICATGVVVTMILTKPTHVNLQ